MSSSLGPFNCITGDGLPITAYILTLSNSQKATTADGASSETQTYIALLRANANETQEVTFYRIIVIDKENANDDQVFQLCRLSSLECAIQARTTDANVCSDKHSSGQKKGKNVYLSVTDDLDVSTLDEIKGFVIKPEVTVLPPPSENIVIFGSKLECDIFQRALAFHSESMDTSVTSVESDDTKPKANAKRRKRSAGSFTVSLRRTSSTDSSEPLAYEVIGMKLAPIKKRKASITVTPTEPISNFYFLLPEDFAQVSDYYALLFSQVKRGRLTLLEAANGNRKNANTSEGYLGIRCRHCGGKPKGSLFPSCAKNLQATPPTLHTHLLKCKLCPEITKHSLKITKAKHKSDMLKIQAGTLTAFYNKLWNRIQDPDFGGEAHTQTIRDRLREIERVCSPSPENNTKASEVEAIPHIVSYDDLENDPLVACAPPAAKIISEPSYALSAGHIITEPTESDWEMALDLLRRPSTPNSRINLQNPPETIAVYPNSIINYRTPIPVRVSESGELYDHNGEFIISDQYRLPLKPDINLGQEIPHTPKPQPRDKILPKKTPDDDPDEVDNKTRSFTRNDEVNLVKGILTHGKQWKKIWDECLHLQHIVPSALKDRARSKRFKGILDKAIADPKLVDDPEALCGSESQYLDYDTDCNNTPVSPYSNMAGETEEKGETKSSVSPQPLAIARFIPGLPIEALVDCSPFRERNKSPSKAKK